MSSSADRLIQAALVVALSALANAACGESPAPEHPLQPVLRMANSALKRMETDIKDYTCVLTKRERVEGRLQETESMVVKVRHSRVEEGRVVAPLSVYVRFLSPAEVKGREVLWVEGHNKGKLIVRNGGPKFEYVTLALPPDSDLAMKQNRYPLTEIGVKNLTKRLIENGQAELKRNECEVKTAPGAKINGRPCTLVQVSHAERREYFNFQFARILVDDEYQLPVYYAAYDWPKEPDGPSRMLEEYTYSDIKLNVGLTDMDFDHRNEKYKFQKTFEP